MHSPSLEIHSKVTTLTLALMLVTLWLLLHGYHGLTSDGQIYAFQALARLHPHLATDLYLQNTSQDEFTIFSPLYARVIAVVGLENAARSLTLCFTAWFLAAAWSVVRAMTGRDAAWLAVAFLLIVAGDYGGSAAAPAGHHGVSRRYCETAVVILSVVTRRAMGIEHRTHALLEKCVVQRRQQNRNEQRKHETVLHKD